LENVLNDWGGRSIMQFPVLKIRGAFWISLLIAYLLLFQPSALAADVRVFAEPGLSNVLVNEYQDITAKVMQFYQDVYKFTPNKSIRVVVAADEAGYIQVLQREGYNSEQAVRTAKASSGVSLGVKPVIVICADKSTNYLARIRVITHEMFHQLQSEQKGAVSAHNWLLEGSAKMSEYVLLEWLEKGSLAAHRNNLINILANARVKANPSELAEGGAKWTSLMEQKMYPYEISELMTDYLAMQAGYPAILRYFANIGETHNRETAFLKTFGMSHDQFVQKYVAYMKQGEAALGQLIFETEGDIAPEVVKNIKNNGKAIEQFLRSEGWKLSQSSRFILVPNQEIMLKVMRRELPQQEESKLAIIAQRATIVGFSGLNFVFDVGKTAEPDRGYSKLAIIVCRSAIVMTAKPAPVVKLYWLYEGTARVLAAKAEEAAGLKTKGNYRRDWETAVKKAKNHPPLAQVSDSLNPAFSRYGEEATYASVALAASYLNEKTSPDMLLRYFTVYRDLNDAPRSFQQVFGMSVEAFDQEYGAAMTGLLK